MHSLQRSFDRVLQRAAITALRAFPPPTVDIVTDVPVVSFTFDDAPDSARTNGARILEAHGARGTFYIAGGIANRDAAGFLPVSADGCRELFARGHEIACHTYSHQHARSFGPQALRADLERNRQFLAEVTGEATQENFAFPYNGLPLFTWGEFRRRYRTCRAGGGRINRGPTDPHFLGAVEIGQAEHSRTENVLAAIDSVVRNPGWLILFTHDVAATPTRYGTTPEDFERIVAHALQQGCVLLPVTDALDRLGVPEVTG